MRYLALPLFRLCPSHYFDSGAIAGDNAQFASIDLQLSGASLIVSAGVTTKRGNLVGNAQDPAAVQPDSNINRPLSGTYTSSNIGNAAIDRLSLWAEEAVSSAIAKATSASSLNSVNTTACGETCSSASEAINNALLLFKDIDGLIEDICPRTNGTVCLSSEEINTILQNYEVSNFGSSMSGEDIQNAIVQLSESFSKVTDEDFLTSVDGAVDDASDAIEEADKLVPRTAVFTSAPIKFAELLPAKVRSTALHHHPLLTLTLCGAEPSRHG